MKLQQHPAYRQFYIAAGNKHLLVFAKDIAPAEINLEDLFNIASDKKFLLIFLFEEYTDAVLGNSVTGLDTAIERFPKSIWWIQDFLNNAIDIQNRPSLLLKADAGNLTGSFSNYSYDNNFFFNTNGNKPVVRFSNDQISLAAPTRMELKIDDSFLGFTQAVILLNKENTGALNFVNNRNTSLVQPVSPYLVKNADRTAIHYFDITDYNKNSEIEVFYFPYPKKSVFNKTDEPGLLTRFILRKKNIRTNLVDHRGSQLLLNSDLQAKLGYTEVEEDGTVYGPYFYFIPTGQAEFLHTGNHIQLGFNGTESITNGTGKLKIDFVKSNTMLSDGEDLLPSLNSCTTKPKLLYDAYNHDAEKSPLFNNTDHHLEQKLFIVDNAVSREVAYEAIPIKTTASPDPLPLIPTLSFKDNPGLAVLEKVFTRIRMKQHTQTLAPARAQVMTADSSYVTPQGFLRSNQTLDFIKPVTAKNKDDRHLQFRFEGVTLLSDFNLSLSKEDVFFVLRPSMLQRTERASIIFDIRGFTVELKEFNRTPVPGPKDDTFIIFKFSRYSFNELLNDPTRWSNFGSYRPNPTAALKLIEDIQNNTKFPNTEDYRYFNDTISKDPNWNGVVVINIPLGDSKNLPSIFEGLSGSQNLAGGDLPGERLALKTGLKFQYVAFPVNKTEINNSVIDISSTAFYGLIDYDILNKPDGKPSDDYPVVSKHFPEKKENVKDQKFVLSKLLVRFENSQIRNFRSYAFWQIPAIFENRVEFGNLSLSHPEMPQGDPKANLVRLEGQYQKNSAGNDEFNFTAAGNLAINFEEDNMLQRINISKIAFGYSEGTQDYRFDIDAKADVNSWKIADLVSIDDLEFQNIGFSFKLVDLKLPSLHFDLSRLLVIPKINFNGKGLLRSFPIRFSYFQNFRFKKVLRDGKEDFDFVNGDFDFLKFPFPHFKLPSIDIGNLGNLFSFIFDFDLGTLGNLGLLKALKGQLLVGWSFKGGFVFGLKLSGPSSDGLHLDLFGALKLDIEQVNFGKFNPTDDPAAGCTAYFLRLVNARMTIFGRKLPDEDHTFNGIIIVDFKSPGNKVAWLINYDKQDDGDLVLGLGQRMGPAQGDITGLTTRAAIREIKQTFRKNLNNLPDCSLTRRDLLFAPDRNYLIASEAILPEDWPIEFAFLFNDPVLYGASIGFKGDFLKGFSIDILYKKLADNLGVYSGEIQLPDALRNQELGGAFLRLPNIGADIFTNGDWKVDIGFPRISNDWSRSGFLQLRTAPPFVGWFGFYVMRSRIASQTLFKKYISDDYSNRKLNIIQAGFAMRVGIGFYFDKGILFVGASISVYGVLEGAFAFERDQPALATLFPDHFALLGRVGALAELVGYVDFGIIKASVYISLRAEFGLLLVYLSKDGIPGVNNGKGIQPVKVYIEGEVRVQVTIKIGCVKIRLSFGASLRFEYTIGGGDGQQARSLASKEFALLGFDEMVASKLPVVITGIKEIPMAYLPGFSKVKENGAEKLVLVHSFMIPFFGKRVESNKVIFSDNNLFKDKIIKPFLTDLISQLQALQVEDHDRYQTLRSVLLNGACFRTVNGKRTAATIDLSVDGYLPTFIHGINATDKATVDKVVKKHFGFRQDELRPDAPNNSIVEAYNDSLLVIPAPVSKKMQLVDENNNILLKKDTEDGFTIRIENLVSKNGAALVESTIAAVRDFDDATLDWINQFYDDYKSQFIQRNQNQALAEPLQNKDLRDEVIIPEFFKLCALLTLEAFYTDANGKVKSKEGEEFNPAISIDTNGHFKYENGGDWDPNLAIEQIVGQLNYFYNSGLRLPFKNNETPTRSINELLHQHEEVAPLTGAPSDLNAIKLFFDNEEITKDVFADNNAKKDMLRFIGLLDTDFKPANLYKEFDPVNPVQFIKPYKLVPVTLVVQDGKFEEKNKDGKVITKFFELPRKLASKAAPGSRYSFELNYANYTVQVDGQDRVEYSTNKSQVPILAGMSRGLNIEVKVRRHTNKILEIVNVLAEDLGLMKSLYKDSFVVRSIDCYHRHDPNPNDPNANYTIDRLIDNFATLLKTNLSPRTSPPVFDPMAIADAVDDNATRFWENSNRDRANFTRLAWEALTTNNGGYFIILDKDIDPNSALGKADTEQSIILSFEGGATDPAPPYFNTVRFSRNASNEAYFETVCAGLKDRSHYIYIDQLKLNANEVKEYHSVIPAHTFGFEVPRYRKQNPAFGTPAYSSYINYLPIEFELLEKGAAAPLLSADKVLPIMPHSQQAADGTPIEEAFIYKHLSPLTLARKDDGKIDTENIYRYDTVGKTYSLKCNLRDTFGFRIGDPGQLATVEYTHTYFDKLVPVDAWPLISFSWWFGRYAKPDLYFNLACNSDIREILDLAGILRKKITVPANPDPVFVPRYDLDEEIDKPGDVEKLLKVKSGILNNLYTILAQLKDKNTIIEINNIDFKQLKPVWAAKVESLIGKILFMTTPTGGKFKMPKENVAATPVMELKLEQKEALMNTAGITITLRRPSNLIHKANDAVFSISNDDHTGLAELENEYIWDYASTHTITTTVKLLNPGSPERSRLADLNNAIRVATKIKTAALPGGGVKVVIAEYSLGIGSDPVSREKVIYMIREGKLSEIGINEVNAAREIDQSCYFGIKPFSNKLWSGEYQPVMPGSSRTTFSNIDLDRSLRLVLSKIDELLQAGTVSRELPPDPSQLANLMNLYETLLSSKRSLVDQKLKSNIAWVMDIDHKPLPGDPLIREFRDLLLYSLAGYYEYDGLAKTTLSGTAILPPQTRLNMTLLPDASTVPSQGYKLYSSKIGDNGKDWYIFFDQKETVQGDIDIRVKPAITHIEFNIVKTERSEIEESQWVQLVTPVEFQDDQYTISKWKKITRQFPAKPVILRHSAEQKTPDNMKPWRIDEIGLWNYALEIEDNYIQNDKIHVDLLIETSSGAQGLMDIEPFRDFTGFIAYWASRILTKEGNVFNWKEFVADLYAQFSAAVAGEAVPFDAGIPYSFELQKGPGKWEIKNITGGLTVGFPKDQLGNPVKTKPAVLIGPFNIFSKEKRVISVLPAVKVFRNPDVKNTDFIYETETVSPVSAATPHIRYFNPIPIMNNETFEASVIGTIDKPVIPNELPMKATAKYLIRAANDFPAGTKNLPVIPVQQVECTVGAKPSRTDALFDLFDKTNGYQAFSVTVYNAEKNTDRDLPVFHADTVFKQT